MSATVVQPNGVIFGAKHCSLSEHANRVMRAAAGLSRLGVQEGSTVLLMMRNDMAFLEALQAIGRLGASPVPANWHGGPEEIEVILRDSGATFAVVHDEFIASHASCWHAGLQLVRVRDEAGVVIPQREQIAAEWETLVASSEPLAGVPRQLRGALIYTSGTTSAPKAIDRDPMSSVQAETMAASLRYTYGFRPGMRALISGPLYHSMSVSYALTAIASMGDSGALFIEPKFDVPRMLSLIHEQRITHVLMVPVMFVRLLRLSAQERSQYNVSCIEAVTHSAAPCSIEVKKAMIEWWGPTLREFYGASETGPATLILSDEYLQRPGSVGRAQSGCEVKILDDQGIELPQGQSGEIAIRNHSYPDFTYRHRPEERTKLDRKGLIAPGDIGYLDSEGYLFLQDRKKDMVITGGVNVFPAEIEGVMLGLDGIKDVAVFGIPDAEFGESIAAHIELWHGQSLTSEDISLFMKARLPSYKCPKVVHFVSSLPRDDNGKIAKRRIADAYWEGAGRRI